MNNILGAADGSGFTWDIFKNVSVSLTILDVLIVTVLFYWVYVFLRETRAMRILYGLFFLLALMMIGRLFNLMLLNSILKYLTTMLVVAIPVVFQPELRGLLEKLGRAKFFNEGLFSKESVSTVINDIIAAVGLLSKEKTGALIIIQRQTGLREYIENGTAVDATVSKSLLLSIFFPKSPLHDGAVIICGDKIISARSTLPVSDTSISSSLGTRHKAGVGITENSDAIALIVSEETGIVSMAVGGKLERRIPEERLKNRLTALLRQNKVKNESFIKVNNN